MSEQRVYFLDTNVLIYYMLYIVKQQREFELSSQEATAYRWISSQISRRKTIHIPVVSLIEYINYYKSCL